VCAVDCGTVVNPDTVRAQAESAIVFGITAALYGEITLKNGRVEQSNFHNYRILRINEAPIVQVHIVQSAESPGNGRARNRGCGSGTHECDLRRNGQTLAQAADRSRPA